MFSRIFRALRTYFNGGPEEADVAGGETIAEGGSGSEPAAEGQGPRPLDLPVSSLVSQFERRAVEDALRHEEDLFVQQIPVVSEVERLAEERLASLRRWADERCLQIEDALAAAGIRRERAEQAQASAEAALRRLGVAEEELALPQTGVDARRVVAFAGLALILAAGAAAFATSARIELPLAALGVAVAAVLVAIAMIGDEERRLRKACAQASDDLDELTLREGELNRELTDMPARVLTLAEAEVVLPGRLVTAYRSTVMRALPPGALSERREFPDTSMPEVEVPGWALNYRAETEAEALA